MFEGKYIYHYYLDSLKWLLRLIPATSLRWRSIQEEVQSSLVRMARSITSFPPKLDLFTTKRSRLLNLLGPKHGEDNTRKLELRKSRGRKLERLPECRRLSSVWVLRKSREDVMRMPPREIRPSKLPRRISRIETWRKCKLRNKIRKPWEKLLLRRLQLPRQLQSRSRPNQARDERGHGFHSGCMSSESLHSYFHYPQLSRALIYDLSPFDLTSKRKIWVKAPFSILRWCHSKFTWYIVFFILF